MFNLVNTYYELGENFSQKFTPIKMKPELLVFNSELASFLQMTSQKEEDIAQILSAQKTLPNSHIIAMAYAGHQFGNFVPSLGDGRAALIGEVKATDQKLYDIHLKGIGPTYFSRGGDGLSPLGPALREYLISEAVFALNIPTTRSLAVVSSGLSVYREEALPGALTTRISKGHIRVGTFEYFAAREDITSLKKLSDYCLQRLYPDCHDYKEMLTSFIHKQANLIAQWLSVGFIHGVMNTDNTSIAGETIDFGPCAFMDNYRADRTFSYIDQYKRYAYKNQTNIAMWNIARFASTLIPLIDSDEKKSIEYLEAQMGFMAKVFEDAYLDIMGKKFGIFNAKSQDIKLINTFLNHLEEKNLDFTNSFRELNNKLHSAHDLPQEFFQKWRQRHQQENKSEEQVKELMNSVNPYIIPRNHLVEKSIEQAYQNDFTFFKRIHEAYKKTI